MADPEFVLLGDALWLDFVNTGPATAGGQDTIPDAAAWHRWTKAARIESAEQAEASEVLRGFRQRLASLARALATGKAAPPSCIEAINARLATREGREHLVRVGGAWQLRFAPARAPTALEAIAHSAAETLANPLVTVRLCSNPACGLYFADDTPGKGRRWCNERRCRQQAPIERRRGQRLTPLITEE